LREVLFRGKDSNGGQWAYGLFVEGNEKIAYIRTWSESGETFCDHSVFANSIGQYTGKTDRFEKKVFEGDIIQHRLYKELRYVVRWDDEYVGFLCENKHMVNSLEFLSILPLHAFEIIGNIYENPELMDDNKYYRKEQMAMINFAAKNFK
jgi:uncharacterized phage protein (TIGR01671 family)